MFFQSNKSLKGENLLVFCYGTTYLHKLQLTIWVFESFWEAIQRMHTCQFEAISQGNWPSLYTLCKADPLKACPITPLTLKDPYFMTTHLWGWGSILVKLTFDVGQSQKLGEKILNLDYYQSTWRFSKT